MKPIWSQMLPKVSPMHPKWYQNAPSFCTCWAKGPADAKHEATWCPNGPKLVPTWCQNGPSVEPKRPKWRKGLSKIALANMCGQKQSRTKKNEEEPFRTKRNREKPRRTKKHQEEPQRIRKNPEKNEAERRRSKNKNKNAAFRSRLG